MTRKKQVDKLYSEIEPRIRNARLFDKVINPLNMKELIIASYHHGLTENIKQDIIEDKDLVVRQYTA